MRLLRERAVTLILVFSEVILPTEIAVTLLRVQNDRFTLRLSDVMFASDTV